MRVNAHTGGLVVNGEADGIRAALCCIAGIDALAANFRIHKTAHTLRVAMSVMSTAILLDAHSAEASRVSGTVEGSRARNAHAVHLVEIRLLRWLAGIRGIANLTRGTDALEAADDVDAVGATATWVSLQTLIHIFTRQVRVAVEANWTDTFDAACTLQADGPGATGNVLTARNGCTGAVRVATGAAVADAFVRRRIGAVTVQTAAWTASGRGGQRRHTKNFWVADIVGQTLALTRREVALGTDTTLTIATTVQTGAVQAYLTTLTG